MCIVSKWIQIFSTRQGSNATMEVRPRRWVSSCETEIIQVFIILHGIPQRIMMLLSPWPTCDKCIIIKKIIF